MPIYFRYETWPRYNWRINNDSNVDTEGDEYIMEDSLFIEGRRDHAINVFLTMFCGYSERQAS